MKTILQYIIEKKLKELDNFKGVTSINEVLKKLIDAHKNHLKFQKTYKDNVDLFIKLFTSKDDSDKKLFHKKWDEMLNKYKALGEDINKQYCCELNCYEWDKLKENDFTKIKCETDEWNKSIINLLHRNKNKKDPCVGLFRDNNNEFKFLIINSLLYDLNFDRSTDDKINNAGCIRILKAHGHMFANTTYYSTKEIIEILKNYDMYIAKEPTENYEVISFAWDCASAYHNKQVK